jgi:superfamily II DNA or RNA helicase
MKSSPAEIYFAGDDLCLTGVEERYLADIPYEKDQQRILTYPSYLKTILKVLNQFEIPIESKLSIDHPLTISFDPKYELRPFQQEAFDEWKKKGRGTLILPTGSGKTFLGLAAIHYLSQATLVLAPTIDLVEQWVSNLQLLGISKKEIGQYGGGRQERVPASTFIAFEIRLDY